MLSTEKLVYEKILSNYHMKTRMCVFKITKRCNCACDCCIENSGPDADPLLMSDEIILEIFKQIRKEKFLINLQGGEPMLYPDKCTFIGDLAHKSGRQLTLVTNGFWGDDPELIEFVNKRLKPDFLLLSIDYWHQQKIPVEYINNIARTLREETLLVSSPVTSNKHGLYSTKTELKWTRCDLGLIPLGRAEKLKDEVIYKDYDEELTCVNTGFAFEPDGKIVPSCKNECWGCDLGKIPGTDLSRMFHLNKPKIHLKGRSYGFAEICRSHKIHILDDKWKDPTYKEYIELNNA